MITIDTNVVAAALIRDSLVRRLLLSLDGCISPYALLDELDAHKGEFLRKSGVPIEMYDQLLALLLSNIRLVPLSSFAVHLHEAGEIMAHIDPDDAPFIACALATGSVLWSDDKRLKLQDAVRVMDTEEMMEAFGR